MADNKTTEKSVVPRQEKQALDQKVLEAVGLISSALAGLSNKQSQQALSMVAALSNLRVVSMDRQMGIPPAAPKAKSEKSGKAKPPPPAAWKQDKRWADLEAEHSTIVGQLKASNPGDVENLNVQKIALRKTEERMKVLKQELKGKSSI